MKTIAILNLKGGTAKTVTSATMARCLSAEHDMQVVLVDADQQGNLSQYFGVTNTSECGNTWTLLTEGAGYWPDFVTADEVIIPIRLDLFSTAGMAELTRQVDSMRQINPRLRVAGILGTQYQRTAEEREIHRLLALESGLPVFRTLIRMSPPVPKSIAARESVLTFSPHCGAAKDYRAFVREYLEGIDNGRL